MAKKKPAKKPVKAKAAVKPAKSAAKKPLLAKILKAVKGSKPKVLAKAETKPTKLKGKPVKLLAQGKPVVEVKGKKGKKSGDLVEVVIAPSNPVLKEVRKGASVKEASSHGKKRCRETACDQEGLMAGYCRLHYIKNWRRIKRKEAILASGQLNNYVEELVKKYPDKYLDVIRQDLASEKEWAKVVIDLELESGDDDAAGEEEVEPVADGVRRDRDFDEEDSGF